MNKNSILFFLLFLIVFGGAVYWYFRGDICQRGITFRIGTLSPEYNLSSDELRMMIDKAADVWEDEIGYSVFRYDPEGRVTVNLIFDERQQKTLQEQEKRGSIKTAENEIENIADSLESLEAQINRMERDYRSLQQEFESERSRLNSITDPQAFNNQVTRVNSYIPRLERMRDDLNGAIAKYNNSISDAQAQVDGFNETVAQYNETYTGSDEVFDKGDYGNNILNLYQYDNEEDLVLLIAHELGHALGIGHVENRESVMYPTLNYQDVARIMLSGQDIDALALECTI